MKGVPDVLRTRQDFENLRDGVVSGKLSGRNAGRAISHWEALLSRHRYKPDRLLDAGEEPDGPEPDYRVMELKDEDSGEVTREQMKREDDPNARIHHLGFTVEGVAAAIELMKGATDA